MNKLFMPIEHMGVVAGFPAVGYGLDTSIMKFAEGNATAISMYNNKRSYSVHVGDDLVGNVHCMSGGRYVGLDTAKNEICTYAGSNAEIMCFVEVARHFTGASNDDRPSKGFPHCVDER